MINLKQFWHRLLPFLLSLICTFGLGPTSHFKAIAQAPPADSGAEDLIQQGKQSYQQGNFSAAIKDLIEAEEIYESQGEPANRQRAVTLTNLGNAQLSLGQAREALQSWQQATKLFQRMGNVPKQVLRSQLHQTKALSSLGLHSQACSVFGEVVLHRKNLSCEEIAKQEDSLLRPFNVRPGSLETDQLAATDLNVLGDIFQAVGELSASESVLNAGLEMESLSASTEAALRLSLGNTLRAQGNLERDRRSPPVYDYLPWRYVSTDPEALEAAKPLYQKAKQAYDSSLKAIARSSSRRTPLVMVQAQLNLLSLETELQEFSEAKKSLSQVKLSNLPAGEATVFAELNLAKQLAYLSQVTEAKQWEEVEERIKNVVKSAEKLEKGERILSYALGNLAGFYEYCSLRPDRCDSEVSATELRQKARNLTEKALILAQPSQSPEIAYHWQWQLGRIAQQEEDDETAIKLYRNSIRTLESTRNDLLITSTTAQFSFRDSVEPLYRNLISLLLKADSTVKSYKNNREKRLDEVRSLIDNLQLAELESFVKCKIQTTKLDSRLEDDNSTLVVYPILLEDRLEIIAKFSGSNNPSGLHEYTISSANYLTVSETIEKFKYELESTLFADSGKQLSIQLYDWIIKPLKDDESLNIEKVDTIVFVADGPLREIPMATLHSGQQFLIEEFNLASSLASDISPERETQQLTAIIAGQSAAPEIDSQGLGKLDAVGGENGEVRKIERILRSNNAKKYQVLLDTDLNKRSFLKAAKSFPYSVIHLATHGQFSSNPDDTYLIPSPREKIRLKEFKSFFRPNRSSPTELLVLSACESAGGDRRAVLGLAGITIRSGVRSTIGSLWNIDDQFTTIFMERFYQELSKDNLSKAQALQNTQISFLKEEGQYNAPSYWAPFILVGDWQTSIE